jgi:hypothetical protein
MHQIGPVEAVHIVPDRENQIAAEMLDTIYRAGVRRAAHRLRLEHLLVRAGERVNIQGALAVRNFSTKDAGSLPIGSSRHRQYRNCTTKKDSSADVSKSV